MSELVRARALRWVLIITTLLAVGLETAVASASTLIPGGNVANKTWTAANGPYVVQGDVTVPAGTFLTIEAGTEVQFVNGDGQGAGLSQSKVEVTIRGTLNALGTSANLIVLKAQSGS